MAVTLTHPMCLAQNAGLYLGAASSQQEDNNNNCRQLPVSVRRALQSSPVDKPPYPVPSRVHSCSLVCLFATNTGADYFRVWFFILISILNRLFNMIFVLRIANSQS